MLTAKIISVCCQPNAVHQRDGDRRIEELPERARRGAEAEGARAPFAAATALPNAARITMNEQPERPKPISTPAETSSIGALVACDINARPAAYMQRAGDRARAWCRTVGDHAGERLADAPQQILQRERKGEYVAAPMIGARHRGEKKAERRTRTERHQRDQAAEADDQRRRAPSRRHGAGLGGIEPIIDGWSWPPRQLNGF